MHLIGSFVTRGETTNELLEHLFKGYLAVTDTDLYDYIKRKKENYAEGQHTIPMELMLLVVNTYKLK
jgi:hypothetical protein